MCNYLSFCISLDGEDLYFAPDLKSHSSIEALHKLEPGTTREGEWTAEPEGALRVRTHEDDPHNDNWLRACMLARWPTRKELEAHIRDMVPNAAIERLVAEVGDNDVLVGGYYSVLAGGDYSTLRAGDWSVLTGGDYSALRAGNWSVLTGGDGSVLTAGVCGVLSAVDRSVLTGGGGSVLSAGAGSVLIWWPGPVVAVVGRDGIKPDTKYCAVGGKVTEVKSGIG